MQVLESLLTNRLQESSSSQNDHAAFIQERMRGASPWTAHARTQVAVHAAHDNTIILEGEPGTGKEYLGRLVHKCSRRSEGPFVSISFDSVSDESAEAALFGSLRTLPTGARHIHRGLIESAEGGVVYIADASKLSLSLRAKLSRLIQHGEFRRLGDTAVQRVDVRVMLGSTGDLSAGPAKEWTLLRTDIRVGDVMSIPPLRARADDIEPLVRHFVMLACEAQGKEIRELGPEALAALRNYAWPGNVAELKSTVEQIIQRCGPPSIDLPMLPSHIVNAPESSLCAMPMSALDLVGEVRRYEKAILCAALKQCQGVQNKAAKLLTLKPTTLNMKLKSYGISADDFKQ
jgi:two-component system response regulator PilR (NtrC family)